MQKNYLTNFQLESPILFKKFAIIIYLLAFINAWAQNSLVGDGFGGRLWYRPYNYTVGAYSGYTICGDSSQLYGWGDNQFGQLGIGNYRNSITPLEVLGMTHLRYFSTGYVMGAIKLDKSAWVWGNLISNKPIKVLGNVIFLDAGYNACAFVKNDGSVWSVGQNTYGSFGNGRTNLASTSKPIKMEVIKNAVRVANGYYCNTILLSNGQVATTGTNFEGCLGTNIPDGKEALDPVIIETLHDIIDIKSTYGTTIALDKFGNVFAWGRGKDGCIGNGNFNASNIPQKISSLENIVAISGCNDGDHFLALDANHNCYGWGANQYGQLGNGKLENICIPQLIAKNVDDIMAGELFSYIIKTNGTIWGTGRSLVTSIWMNLINIQRTSFVKLSPQRAPMNLCEATKFTPKKFISVHINLCEGETIQLGNLLIKTDYIKIDTFSIKNNMDSIVTTYVHLISKSFKKQTITLCYGATYLIGKHHYSVSGIYRDTITNYRNCDSIVITNLTIKSLPFSQKTVTIICGEKLLTNGRGYTSPCIFSDTFSSTNGCDSIVWTTLKVIPRAPFNQTILICKGEQFKIGKHIYTEGGNYLDTLQNSLGCDSVLFTTIIINSLPITNFDLSSTNILTDDTLHIINTTINANIYLWHYGLLAKDTSTKKNPMIIFQKDGIKNIQLTAKNSVTGCSNKIAKTIEVTDNSDIYVPNVLTPNNDGINDYFYPVLKNYDKLNMQIYDRWGELIYETNRWNEGWNGTSNGENCITSVYLYKIKVSNSNPIKSKTFCGTLNLLR